MLTTPEERNGIYIHSILEKAECVCPGSLAILGVNGSFLTGDTHAKSDLDLLILINDEAGLALKKCFIEQRAGVAHDFYCTRWDRLEAEAAYPHPHIQQLLESEIVYCASDTALARLEALRFRCRSLLSAPFSPTDYEKAEGFLLRAEQHFAEALLSDTLTEARNHAAAFLQALEDGLMMLNKRYYRLGVRRVYEELDALPFRPPELREDIEAVVRSESTDALQESMTLLLRRTRDCFSRRKAALPLQKTAGGERLVGSYEEFYSNWRNKLLLAAETGDAQLAFMSLGSADAMFAELAGETDIGSYCVMAGYDPGDLRKTAAAYVAETERYLAEYEKYGLPVAVYPDAEAFRAEYGEG